MTQNQEAELEWVQLQKDVIENFGKKEGVGERIMRKSKESPLVPIGCLLTVSALLYGLYNLKKGDSKMQQMMMRARVIAQGFTIFAAFGGTLISIKKKENTLDENSK